MQASEVDDYVKWQTQALKGASQDNIWKRYQEGFKGYTADTFKLLELPLKFPPRLNSHYYFTKLRTIKPPQIINI
jgi:hypothetical protein